MKFELEPYHRNLSEKELLNDLKEVAKKLNKSSLTQFEYNKNGKFNHKTMHNRFGSWLNAIEKAGLNRKTNIGTSVTDEELYNNIEEVWIKLGRQPKYEEVKQPLSKYHSCTYERHFGGWRKSLEKFVEYINKEKVLITENLRSIKKNSKRYKTSKSINLRLRFIVMRRDDFKCRICGRSPATQTGLELQVDHIVPWSKGGETFIENLQTLCFDCNQGKSNLPMI
ncbi:MAG: homing endonuclease associated repeat-containing protein [Planctomycetota bacterium]|jgi:5-methylcytosine-specific restriction endonuclease McrA